MSVLLCYCALEPEPTPEPEPAPGPTAPADRQAAIDVTNAYAMPQYGVVTTNGLTPDNSAYRFPATVPVEAKARDMVDFTFRQLMMQAGKDSVAAPDSATTSASWKMARAC